MGRYVTSTTQFLPLDIAPRKGKVTCRDIFTTLLVFDGERTLDTTNKQVSTSAEEGRWLQCFGSSADADMVAPKSLSQSQEEPEHWSSDQADNGM